MFEKSTAALDEAVRIQPAVVLYRNNIAMVLVDLGQIEAAYSHLAAVHPEAVAHYNLGYLLLKKGKTRRPPASLPWRPKRIRPWFRPSNGCSVSSPRGLTQTGGRPQPAPPRPEPFVATLPANLRITAPSQSRHAMDHCHRNSRSERSDKQCRAQGLFDVDASRHQIFRLPDVAADPTN